MLTFLTWNSTANLSCVNYEIQMLISETLILKNLLFLFLFKKHQTRVINEMKNVRIPIRFLKSEGHGVIKMLLFFLIVDTFFAFNKLFGLDF